MQQLGSKDLIPIGLGDDQGKFGYFTELDRWIAKLLPVIHLVETARSSPDRIDIINESQSRLDHYEVTMTCESSTDVGVVISELPYKVKPYGEEEVYQLLDLFTEPDGLSRLSCQNIAGIDKKLLPIMAIVKVSHFCVR